MKLALLLTVIILTFVPALAQDPILPEDSCVQCFEDSLLVGGTREDKCYFVINHCSPCYHLVAFWCNNSSSRQARVEQEYWSLPTTQRHTFVTRFLQSLEGNK